MARKTWFTIVALACLSVPLAAAEKPKPLFDGKSLKGWVPRGEAKFTVEDGVIVGRTGKGKHGWLCTPRTYGDFILELEVKTISGNSGVQIRSHFEPGDKMVGYQIEVDPLPRAWSGGLYEQGRRGWLQSLADNPAARAAFNTNEWNRYRIECVGDSIRSWVNDVPAADYRDSMDVEGLIALQVHSGKNVEVRFRNIRIQDLGRHEWKPLWNKKDFSGWHIIGKGDWKIVNGTIVSTHAKEEKEFGHLVTDKVFSDFTARVDFKAVKGNSGFYFRIEEKGASGVSGFQAEIDAENDVGGLYETNGRAWVVKPAAEQVKKWFRPQDWNTVTVSAHGKRIAVDVNGFRTAELLDDPGRLEGHLALQAHGNQDCEVHFRNIEILQKAK
jgi:hypothetical protein